MQTECRVGPPTVRKSSDAYLLNIAPILSFRVVRHSLVSTTTLWPTACSRVGQNRNRGSRTEQSTPKINKRVRSKTTCNIFNHYYQRFGGDMSIITAGDMARPLNGLKQSQRLQQQAANWVCAPSCPPEVGRADPTRLIRAKDSYVIPSWLSHQVPQSVSL